MTGSRSHPAHQINGVTELNCASFTSFYSVNSNEFQITNLAARILKQMLRFSIYNYATNLIQEHIILYTLGYWSMRNND